MQLMKLLMTWDIIPGQEQAYVDFNAKVFVPQLMKFGLRPVDSWFTLYGNAPQVTVGWVADDVAVIQKALNGEAWAELLVELRKYVAHFRYKIVPFTGLFQM
jgi:hypothetical protein